MKKAQKVLDEEKAAMDVAEGEYRQQIKAQAAAIRDLNISNHKDRLAYIDLHFKKYNLHTERDVRQKHEALMAFMEGRNKNVWDVTSGMCVDNQTY